MTAAIAKYAANKMLSKEMHKYKDKKVDPNDQYDPYYVMIPHPTKKGKFKKVKKQIPAYIPEKDGEILAAARKSAYRLDYCLFNLFGLRFGWSSVIGVVPAAGDALDVLLGVRLILRMRKITGGLPKRIFLTMVAYLAFDLVVGLVPFLGDLLDAYFKANSWNVRLLEEHLDKLYKPEALKEQDAKNKVRPASVYVDLSDEEDSRKTTFEDDHDDVRRPNRTYSSTRTRIPDEEMGFSRQEKSIHAQQPIRNDRGTRNGRR